MEIWKDIEGYEGYYQISNYGNVRGLTRTVVRNTGEIITIQGKTIRGNNCKGYLTVCLSKDGKQKRYRINRLVAIAFIDNPYNYPEVNHIDEIKTNNCADNLEWCTPIYNSNYGTKIERQSGVNNWKSKKILCLNNNTTYETIKRAANALCLPPTCIRRVVNKERESYRGYRFTLSAC